jgi:hypothetical protein
MTRESKTHIDHPRLIFRETFQDEQSVRRNGGIPTDVTFSNGVASFNGTSSVIDYGNSGQLEGKQQVTIIIRFKIIDPTGGTQYFFSDYLASSDRVGIGISSSVMYFVTSSNDTARYATVAHTSTEWNTVVMVFDGTGVGNTGRLKAYQNGEALTLAYPGSVIPVALQTGLNDFTIGDLTDANYYEGDIDLVEIYNYALSQEEILNMSPA